MSDVNYLADLTHYISAVIGPRDAAEEDDVFTLSSLKRENNIRRKRQERKLRRLVMTREIQRINFEDKLYLEKINKVVDTARRDVTDRKTFVGSPFNGSSSLTSFIDDLRTEKWRNKNGRS